MTVKIYVGDCLERLRELAAESVHMIATSPPYWGLRDYQVEGQIGLEETPGEYIANLVAVFREARRVLRADGVVWLNLGDSFQDKQLLMIPARVALALQADGWWLRSQIIWYKPNCLSGGATVYVQSQKGEMPMMVKDLVRLDPATVKLWNGEKWTQAVAWMENPRPDNPVEIELRSGERIGCTPDHLWPTRRGNVRADELQVGDVIESANLPEPTRPEVPAMLPDSIGWLVGMYLAEGSRSGNCIQIASHKNEMGRYHALCKIADAYGGTCRRHETGGNAATINLHGKMLHAIINTYISSNTSKNKRLSVACWQRNNDFLDYVLRGYLEGDGHDDPNNDRWRLGFTRNDGLASDLRTIAARLGLQIRLKTASVRLNGKRYPTYRGELRYKPSEHSNTKNDGEIIRIGRSRARKFWDIAVEDEPHLFALASGVLTHNCMPESVTDRPTNDYEVVYLLAKAERYYYDADAIREPISDNSKYGGTYQINHNDVYKSLSSGGRTIEKPHAGRNKRAVWSIPTRPYSDAHFATFPPDLVEPMIKAGTSERGACPECGRQWERVVEKGEPQPTKDNPNPVLPYPAGSGHSNGTGATTLHMQREAVTVDWRPGCACDAGEPVPAVVLDPFAGAGTALLVADRLGRGAIGIELNEEYARMAYRRIAGDAPLFTDTQLILNGASK